MPRMYEADAQEADGCDVVPESCNVLRRLRDQSRSS